MKRSIAAVMLVAAAICSNASAKIPVGNKIADLSIKAISLHTPVFQGGPDLLDGTPWPPELRHGPALYPGNAYPCTAGTVALAGHHLTNSHPFKYVSQLKPGEQIKLTTRYGSCTYFVRKVFSTTDDSLWVLNWTGGSRRALVFTTCDQIYDSTGRMIALRRTILYAVADQPLP